MVRRSDVLSQLLFPLKVFYDIEDRFLVIDIVWGFWM